MNLDFFTFGGYGLFVWPSFIFTFIICFSFYLKTKKELKIQEKIFLKEFKQISTGEIEANTEIDSEKIHSPSLI